MITKHIYNISLYSLAATLLIAGCTKTPETKSDSRLQQNHYCNDPDAVNYNFNFPGVPDNSLCFFPTQVFKGNYMFLDSVLDIDFQFKSVDTGQLTITALDNTHLAIAGFCGKDSTSGQTPVTLRLTANRYYKAFVDSTPTNLTGYNTKLPGWILCRNVDTLSGYLQKYAADSSRVLVRFTVATDSGFAFHWGTAIKQ